MIRGNIIWIETRMGEIGLKKITIDFMFRSDKICELLEMTSYCCLQ